MRTTRQARAAGRPVAVTEPTPEVDAYGPVSRVVDPEPALVRHGAEPLRGAAAIQYGAACERLLGLAPHRHVATALSAGRDSTGRPRIAYRGGSLTTAGDLLLERGAFPPDQVIRIGIALANALEHAQAADIRHGNVNPGFVLIDVDAALLAGLATHAVGPPRMDRPEACVHLAPELLEGHAVSALADVYGLGITLATLAYGVPVHAGAGRLGLAPLIHHVLRDELPAPTGVLVPDALLDVIRTAAAADPAYRHRSAGELAEALREAAERMGVVVGMALDSGAAVAVEPARMSSTERAVAGDAEAPPARSGRGGRRVLAISAALAICALAAMAGVIAGDREEARSAPASLPSRPPSAGAAHAAASPTVHMPGTPTPARTSALRGPSADAYRPYGVRVAASGGQVVVTWQLPPEADADGAGIIVRQSPSGPAPSAAILPRTAGSLPLSYVASAVAGDECFQVAVLIELRDGTPELAESDPACLAS